MNLKRLFHYWTLHIFSPNKLLRHKYESFKELLRHDKKSLELLTELEEIQHANTPVDWARVQSLVRALVWSTSALLRSLSAMHPTAYDDLERGFARLAASLTAAISLPAEISSPPYTLSLEEAAQNLMLAGGKAHTLGRLLVATGLPVPRGFVITTNAFHLYLEHNNLRPHLDELLAAVDLDDQERLHELSREMTAIIQEGELPPVVRQELAQRLVDLQQQGLAGPWCLRSSALCEDGQASFAGQYDSVLQVASADLEAAYKKVLASKYAPRALAYRLRCGLADQETPMATLVLEMIDAQVSGVIYTCVPEPGDGALGRLAIYVVPGLGWRLVAGRATPKVHYFSRDTDPHPQESIINHAGRRVREEPETSCLSSESARLLAGWAMRLEKFFGCPQDIEWCQDKQGTCFILQTRPLKTGSDVPTPRRAKVISPVDYPVLLAGGITASPGVGIGRIYLAGEPQANGQLPQDAVLVSATLPPALLGVIDRLRAVVAEGGSQASHFACVARELRLPVIVGAKDAARRLAPGQIVTVDADHGRVYLGAVEGLEPEPTRPFITPEAPFPSRLQKLMELIAPLHLTDPAAPEFAPPTCRSVHDFVRFAHEKGMAEMFSLVGRSGRGLTQARRLASPLPLVMYVLDLEGGISPKAVDRKTVAPDDITSRPMRACWEGLTHPEVLWHQGLRYLDWEEFDRISPGIMSLKSARLASYAVFSRDYLHLVLRFGYHFAVLDALSEENPEANYITFRFKGGGGSYQNRLRRVQLISLLLKWAGFTVKVRGDLLDAHFERHEADRILSRLKLLGILQGKTQLLDISLTTDEQVADFAESFKTSFSSYLEAPSGSA